MYTIEDYNQQMNTVKNELSTLKDIVDEFVERWQTIQENIEELDNNLDEINC